MPLNVFGLNYKTADLTLRGQLSFSDQDIIVALNSLSKNKKIDGAVIVATCNRTEIYIESETKIKQEIVKWLADFKNVSQELLNAHCYFYQNIAAVQHLMELAAGLNSLVIGEPQILGQLKHAFALSQQEKSLAGEITQAFERSFKSAKTIRTRTKIGTYPVSVAYSATLLAQEQFYNMENVNVLLIGAGATIELVSKHLTKHEIGNVYIANRTLSKAQILAKSLEKAQAIELKDIEQYLSKVDLIISSTSSFEPIIKSDMVIRAQVKRAFKDCLYIDLAVPRDIEASISTLDNCKLYCIDDLQSIVAKNIEQRKLAANQAQEIIKAELELFINWQQDRDAVTYIREYRMQAEHLMQAQLHKGLRALNNGSNPQKVLAQMVQQLTNKLTHVPTVMLHEAAQNQDQQILSVFGNVLGIDQKQ